MTNFCHMQHTQVRGEPCVQQPAYHRHPSTQTTRNGPALGTPAHIKILPLLRSCCTSFTAMCFLGSIATAHGLSKTPGCVSQAAYSYGVYLSDISPERVLMIVHNHESHTKTNCLTSHTSGNKHDHHHLVYHRELQSPVCVLAWRHPASVIQSLSLFDIKASKIGMDGQRYDT